MLYLDTSALLKLYIRAAGSEAVQARVQAQDAPLPVWEIQEMEFINALHLKVFWGDVTPRQAAGQIELFHRRQAQGLYVYPDIRRGELSAEFRGLSRQTERLGCRTLDVLHVACAVHIAATEFLTFDDRQRKLARSAGLAVTDLGAKR
jgi:predicted nucleic acid-binding protein